MNDKPVAMIRAARLDEYERRAGTGHSAIDVPILVAECRRFRAFLNEIAVELDGNVVEMYGDAAGLVARIRAAARAVGE